MLLYLHLECTRKQKAPAWFRLRRLVPVVGNQGESVTFKFQPPYHHKAKECSVCFHVVIIDVASSVDLRLSLL